MSPSASLVAAGELAAPGHDLGEPAELDQADRRLQVGHPEVEADLEVLLRPAPARWRAGRRRETLIACSRSRRAAVGPVRAARW